MVCCDGESKNWHASSKSLKHSEIEEMCINFYATGDLLKAEDVGRGYIVNEISGKRTPLSEAYNNGNN